MPTSRKSIKTLIRFTNELLRQSVIGRDAPSATRVRRCAEDGHRIPHRYRRGRFCALASAEEVTPNRWFLSGADFFAVRKIKGNDDRYVLECDITRDTTYRLFGVPGTVTNKLPAGKAILANMSEVAVTRDLAASVTLLSERYAEFDEQAIRVVSRYVPITPWPAMSRPVRRGALGPPGGAPAADR